jgi:hypothetical protein
MYQFFSNFYKFFFFIDLSKSETVFLFCYAPLSCFAIRTSGKQMEKRKKEKKMKF